MASSLMSSLSSLTVQISQILRHPALGAPYTAKDKIPSLDLPNDFPPTVPFSVLQDVCFLASLNQEFFLCETYKRIKDKIMGPVQCWEKRWAGFLCRWKQTSELEWEDVPQKAARATSESISQHERSQLTY